MFWRKKTLYEVVEECIEKLRISIGKLQIARNMIERTRRQKVDKLLLQTALTGIPMSSRDLAHIYINSAVGDLRYIFKAIKNVEQKIIDKYFPTYIAKLKPEFDSVKNVLSNLKIDSNNIDESIEKLTNILVNLENISSYLRNYHLSK